MFSMHVQVSLKAYIYHAVAVFFTATRETTCREIYRRAKAQTGSKAVEKKNANEPATNLQLYVTTVATRSKLLQRFVACFLALVLEEFFAYSIVLWQFYSRCHTSFRQRTSMSVQDPKPTRMLHK
jgi:hypothetical protein